MQNYPRRGYFPDDAESAYRRWRDTPEAVVMTRFANSDADRFECLVRSVWLAGWHTRGLVAYGLPDLPAED